MTVITLVALLIGILLLWISQSINPASASDPPRALWLEISLANLGGFICGTAAVTLVWEYAAKKVFVEDLFDAVRLSSDIRTAGINSFTLTYHEIEWRSLFRRVESVDLFFSYAQTWRNTYVDEMRKMANNKNVELRVALPNPENEDVLNTLALRFDSTPDEVKNRIESAVRYFKKHFGSNESGATCVLYHVDVSPEYAFYRFDDEAVITFFNHLGRTGKVPTVEVSRGGSLFEFAQSEFDKLVGLSKQNKQHVEIGAS